MVGETPRLLRAVAALPKDLGSLCRILREAHNICNSHPRRSHVLFGLRVHCMHVVYIIHVGKAPTQLGFTLGNVVGMYLAQNYDMPNLAKKFEEIKKDLEAKKKPPSS